MGLLGQFPDVTGLEAVRAEHTSGMTSPRLRDLLDVPERIGSVPPNVIPGILGELEALRVSLLVRLLTHPATVTPPGDADETSKTPDRLLRPAEAAALLKVTIRWLYTHHRTLPFARKLSRRVLRFSQAGMQQWLANRRRI